MSSTDRDARLKAQREWRSRNREKLARKQRMWRASLKVEVLEQYGTECSECGFDDPRALHIDHIDNNGSAERKSLGGQQFSGWKFYHYLKQQGWPEGYQTLCANHNQIKYLTTLEKDDILEE